MQGKTGTKRKNKSCNKNVYKCRYCGSEKHKSKACSIQHKHKALIDGVPFEKCGFDCVIAVG